MIDAAFVVAREIAELLLIAAAVRGLLAERSRRELGAAVPIGMSIGIATGLAVLSVVTGSLPGARGEAWMALVLGGATLWLSLSMLHSDRSIHEHVEDRLDQLLETRSAFAAVAALCALAACREMLEIGIFLRAQHTHEGLQAVVTGALLGAGLAGAAGWAFRSMWGRLRLRAIYRISTVILCFIAVELLLGAAASLIEESLSGSRWADAWVDAFADSSFSTQGVAAIVTLLTAFWMLRRWWRESSAAQG